MEWTDDKPENKKPRIMEALERSVLLFIDEDGSCQEDVLQTVFAEVKNEAAQVFSVFDESPEGKRMQAVWEKLFGELGAKASHETGAVTNDEQV